MSSCSATTAPAPPSPRGALAEARGEYVSPRDVMAGNVGRTHREILEYAVAQMDREDAAQRHWMRKHGITPEDLTADTTARSPVPPRVQRWRDERKAERELDKRIVETVDGVRDGEAGGSGMSEPLTSYEATVAAAREAVDRAAAAAAAQQQAAVAWLDADVPARKIVDPERFQH